MDPATIAILSALISAGGSIAGGFLQGDPKQPAESESQKRTRELLDDLIASVKGEGGSFAGLFQADEAAFDKSIRQPALNRFRTQRAPQIRETFLAANQQGGTALEDSLTRAGVDLNSILDESFLSFQQGAQDRQVSVLNAALGATGGVDAPQPPSSFGETFRQGAGGFLQGENFGESIDQILDAFRNKSTQSNQLVREGFER